MGHFRCWSIRNLLDLHADGRLTAGCARRVAAHLSSCQACLKSFQALGRVTNLLKKAPRAPAPEGLAPSILEQLRAPRQAHPAVPLHLEHLRLNCAQAVALVYLVLLMGSQVRPAIPSQGGVLLISESRP